MLGHDRGGLSRLEHLVVPAGRVRAVDAADAHGRLAGPFDAVAACLGLASERQTYEGEASMLLQAVAETAVEVEIAERGHALHADIDATDTHTVTASYNNDASWTGGALTPTQIAAISSTSGFVRAIR